MLKHFIVMGVTSCGKSTVAVELAQHYSCAVIEADDLHGELNVSKMQSGIALTDEDRWPWLDRVSNAMNNSSAPVFVSCSALRRAYREHLINNTHLPIAFIHLHANHETISKRMTERSDHFMPISLLESQLQLLEPLQDDEHGCVVDVAQPLNRVVAQSIEYIDSQKP